MTPNDRTFKRTYSTFHNYVRSGFEMTRLGVVSLTNMKSHWCYDTIIQTFIIIIVYSDRQLYRKCLSGIWFKRTYCFITFHKLDMTTTTNPAKSTELSCFEHFHFSLESLSKWVRSLLYMMHATWEHLPLHRTIWAVIQITKWHLGP